MQLLITNDDGVDAPGLDCLHQAVRETAATTVLAPDRPHSGCGHQVTNHRSLQLTELGAGRFAIDGTPADCTRVGLRYWAEPFDWVLAGVNAGGNLGVDVVMSGTVAAAREAVWLGTPAIAISQFCRSRPIRWDHTQDLCRRALEFVLSQPTEALAVWNVNLPDTDDEPGSVPIQFAELEAAHLDVAFDKHQGGLQFRGSYADRPRSPGSDVDVCFSGGISVTRLTWP